VNGADWAVVPVLSRMVRSSWVSCNYVRYPKHVQLTYHSLALMLTAGQVSEVPV